MFHHLLVHLQPETKISIMVIPKTSKLDLYSVKVVCHKLLTRLLHVLGVVELTLVSVVMAR